VGHVVMPESIEVYYGRGDVMIRKNGKRTRNRATPKLRGWVVQALGTLGIRVSARSGFFGEMRQRPKTVDDGLGSRGTAGVHSVRLR
jgi:hypothetical protein